MESDGNQYPTLGMHWKWMQKRPSVKYGARALFHSCLRVVDQAISSFGTVRPSRRQKPCRLAVPVGNLVDMWQPTLVQVRGLCRSL